MEKYTYLFNEPQGAMSLENMRNTLRGLHELDVAPLRPTTKLIIDQFEYPTNAAINAVWVNDPDATITTDSTVKQEGTYSMKVVSSPGGGRVNRTVNLDISNMATAEFWQRCDASASTLKFRLEDSSGDQSIWDVVTDATPDTWVLSQLDLSSPDETPTATPADLSDIVEVRFYSLDASESFWFDYLYIRSGLRINVNGGSVGDYFEQVYVSGARIVTDDQLSPLITNPTTNPRIDVLTVDSSGTYEWTQGAEAASPIIPVWASEKLPICAIYNRVGQSFIVDFDEKDNNPTEGYIYKDLRNILGTSTDEKTKVSSADTTTGLLTDKIAVGANLVKTILTPAGNEQLEITIKPEKITNWDSAFAHVAQTNNPHAVNATQVNAIANAAGAVTGVHVGFDTDDVPEGSVNKYAGAPNSVGTGQLKSSLGAISFGLGGGLPVSQAIYIRIYSGTGNVGYATRISAGVTATTHSSLTLPGGLYGFYPQTSVGGLGSASAFIYAQHRYITASGPDHWTWIMTNKETGEIVAIYSAPDHHTANTPMTEIEIPHPFNGYNSEKHIISLIDNEFLNLVKNKITRKMSLIEVISNDFEIDYNASPKFKKREIIEINEFLDEPKGEIIKQIKTPTWAKIAIKNDKINIEKRKVIKLPKGINYNSLKLKA